MAASSSATVPAASSGLTREASIYSWTIDELHSTVANNRGVGSMNMDELLKNICSAEESGGGGGGGGGGGEQLLGRQGSLTLPPSIVNKTVEEVWKEIQTSACGSAVSAPVQRERELTLGEMTLEDFLAKAGVVRDDSLPTNPQEDWLNFQFKAAQGPQPLTIQHPQQHFQRQQQPMFGKNPTTAAIPALQSSSTGSILEASMESGATSSFAPAFGGLSPASASAGTIARGKKRVLDAPEDKAVEQRQRRMIKNRESAARSRERKQAYTVELEAQVTQLKEENAELSRLELMEIRIPVEEMRTPPRVLRRTRTAHWGALISEDLIKQTYASHCLILLL
ncbi:ABSCISIC ACID-INSENSITIVE 5-like protein 2 isoform X2 [Cryptomeria japonica]|uniref:ABSCISIC ACID-INSENSITIVE 5-like protein 2 isoform X2 n=2 Tax=Cryptomeria japonica TaxID=3369 RepID=UPI0027D9F8D8|nr:ABSCISIC ACID-INSENSITIVE 5-like protein 2 isoform X2 [Cryptomeria japonica]